MERYNLLFLENDNTIEYQVLKTDSYLSLLTQKPGLQHENYGDFYTTFSQESITSHVIEAVKNVTMEASPSEMDEIIHVDHESSVPQEITSSQTYIMAREHGISLWQWKPTSEVAISCWHEWSLIYGVSIVDKLFSPDHEGTLQRTAHKISAEFEKIEETLSTIDGKLDEYKNFLNDKLKKLR